MKDLKLFYEVKTSKNGKDYVMVYTEINGIKIYLNFIDATSYRIFCDLVRK